MSTPTYRPGDIAMVTVYGFTRPGMHVEDEYDNAWAFPNGDVAHNPDAVGPVLGNVADIAAAEQRKYEAAMNDYADHTTHGNTWIEENE